MIFFYYIGDQPEVMLNKLGSCEFIPLSHFAETFGFFFFRKRFGENVEVIDMESEEEEVIKSGGNNVKKHSIIPIIKVNFADISSCVTGINKGYEERLGQYTIGHFFHQEIAGNKRQKIDVEISVIVYYNIDTLLV